MTTWTDLVAITTPRHPGDTIEGQLVDLLAPISDDPYQGINALRGLLTLVEHFATRCESEDGEPVHCLSEGTSVEYMQHGFDTGQLATCAIVDEETLGLAMVAAGIIDAEDVSSVTAEDVFTEAVGR